jgi:hypothetical protein
MRCWRSTDAADEAWISKPGQVMPGQIGREEVAATHTVARIGARVADTTSSTLLSLLSLKLLLLAFFILLNAMSDLEALKVRAVLESVTKAFDGRLNVENNVTLRGAADGPLDGTQLLLEGVGDLFRDMLPAVHKENTATSSAMVFELPIGTFFAKGENRLQAGRSRLLDRLVESLVAFEEEQVPYSLAVLHGRRAGSATSDELRIDRIAVLVRGLVQRGLPADRLSFGLYDAPAESFRLELDVKSAPGVGADLEAPR